MNRRESTLALVAIGLDPIARTRLGDRWDFYLVASHGVASFEWVGLVGGLVEDVQPERHDVEIDRGLVGARPGRLVRMGAGT